MKGRKFFKTEIFERQNWIFKKLAIRKFGNTQKKREVTKFACKGWGGADCVEYVIFEEVNPSDKKNNGIIFFQLIFHRQNGLLTKLDGKSVADRHYNCCKMKKIWREILNRKKMLDA